MDTRLVFPGDNGETRLSLHRWIIAGLWLLFVAYWAVAGAGAKRRVSTGSYRWRWEIGLRLLVILLILALLLVFAGPYFIYSGRREEAVMLQLFPDQYAVYMARTGTFAPCPFRRG